MTSQNEHVSDLVAITGTSEVDARDILEKCGYSLERAAEYYFQRDSLKEERSRHEVKRRTPNPTLPIVCPSAEELSEMFPVLDKSYLTMLVRRQGHDGDAIIRRLIRESQEEESTLQEQGPGEVYLNVYNLVPEKEFLTKVGLGVYHSGLEVYGREWSFGGCCEESYTDYSGIFHCEPKTATPNMFKQLKLGTIHMSHRDLYFNVIKPLHESWTMGTYHLIQRNCNHFAQQLAAALKVKSPPSWVNRSARIGDTMIPMRVVNYFLNGNTPPQKKTADEEQREKALDVGNLVQLHNPVVLPSKDTGHTCGICVSSLTRGIVIVEKKKGGKLLLQFPRQLYQDADSGESVLLGPFEYIIHAADLDPADSDSEVNLDPLTHDIQIEDISDSSSLDDYESAVLEVTSLLPLHPVPLVREYAVKHQGDVNKIVEELLG